MSANSRMTVAVHILSFMILWAQKHPEPATSERIAHSVNTNPVVIRRLLGLLQKGGLVKSQRGVNAGWRLAKRPTALTLPVVFRGVRDGPLFAAHAPPPDRQRPIGRRRQPAARQVDG